MIEVDPLNDRWIEMPLVGVSLAAWVAVAIVAVLWARRRRFGPALLCLGLAVLSSAAWYEFLGPVPREAFALDRPQCYSGESSPTVALSGRSPEPCRTVAWQYFLGGLTALLVDLAVLALSLRRLFSTHSDRREAVNPEFFKKF